MQSRFAALVLRHSFKSKNMNKHQTSLFAIIGGGIAGLSTAIALKRIGIEVTVFEAAPEFQPVGAGIMLAANAMKAFAHLGIDDKISRAGRSFNSQAVLSQSGKTITRFQTDAITKDFTNVAIHRGDLHQVLLEQLDPSQVFTGKRSTGIKSTHKGYVVSFADGTSVLAKYVIVAEGIHSTIRQSLLPEAEKRYSGYTCWRGIADNSELNITEPTETWGCNGRFGLVPLNDHQLYWFAVKNAPESSEEMKKYTLDDLLGNYKYYHRAIGQALKATPEKNILLNDIHDLNPIDRYAFGNVVLIGDAAHATTPNLGQGACQSVEDAVVLADCLLHDSLVQDAFQSFERKRLQRTHFIVNQSWQMGRIGQWTNPAAMWIRNCIIRSLPDAIALNTVKKVYDFRIE